MSKKPSDPKTTRTEIVSVRMDSKLMMAVRLAAGHERRSVSSFVEWAASRACEMVKVSLSEDEGEMTALEVVEQVWDSDEPKRLLSLATLHPALLTHEEELLWNLIWNSTAFSRPRPQSPKGLTVFDPAVFVDWDAVHKHWNTLKQVASGKAGPESLPRGKTIGESKLSARQNVKRTR